MKNVFLRLRRFQSLAVMALLYLPAGILLRIVLWTAFGRPAGAEWLDLLLALPLGAVNDLIVLIYLLFPLTLILTLTPQWLANSRPWRWLAWGSTTAIIFGILYLACAEYFFFEEFNARFNLVAVDYLVYPHEVFINIWETYHVLRFLVACGLTTTVILFALRRFLFQNQPQPARFKKRWLMLVGHLVVLVLALTGISTDSLGWTGNRVTKEIIANGISSLFRALHTNELNYAAFYPIMQAELAFTLMRNELGGRGGVLESTTPRDINRSFQERAGLGKRNVVVIVEESFGAQFVGAYGDKRGLTPNFDRLADQGLLFANAYASGTRTVRGLEAIVTSLPPIPSEGIIKRPGSWPIANWGEVLRRQGYDTSFLYGGYGLFDNMNPFFGGNGFTLVDRNDIRPVTFSNIWGVCDQDLFNQALRTFDSGTEAKKPFFSVIMTTSNHSPYTFPTGMPGVNSVKGGRSDGIRYADFALGEFMDKASTHSWYRDTIFVVVADHDARVYGSEQIPLKNYRIPLLLLAPGSLEPQLVSTPTSQIDIAPTVMGLLGLAYQAPFYGQDVLHAPANQLRPIVLNHDHDVGLLLGDRLAVLGLQQEVHCYRVGNDDDLTSIANDPTLVDLTIAYFQTAFDLFQGRDYQLPLTVVGQTPKNDVMASDNSGG